ncbi:MAG: hypothetical protein VW124_14005 [Paracoccaceae bacterium]
MSISSLLIKVQNNIPIDILFNCGGILGGRAHDTNGIFFQSPVYTYQLLLSPKYYQIRRTYPNVDNTVDDNSGLTSDLLDEHFVHLSFFQEIKAISPDDPLSSLVECWRPRYSFFSDALRKNQGDYHLSICPLSFLSVETLNEKKQIHIEGADFISPHINHVVTEAKRFGRDTTIKILNPASANVGFYSLIYNGQSQISSVNSVTLDTVHENTELEPPHNGARRFSEVHNSQFKVAVFEGIS